MAVHERKSGRCLCGVVTFTATPLTLDIDACHCGKCRKWSGGVFLCAPCADVTVEDAGAITVYKSSDYGERGFCKSCGSSLFWRMQDHSFYAVSVQAFDDQSSFVFAEEVFVDDKPALYAFANDTRKLTGGEFFARAMARQESSGG